MITVYGIYFSPTGNTKTIVHSLAENHKNISFIPFDITLKKNRQKWIESINKEMDKPDFWIIGSPVYSGKLPDLVIEQLKLLNGNNIATLAIVTYGNKSYGIALKQLYRGLLHKKFLIKGMAAFAGEHSFSELFSVGLNRPDTIDTDYAHEFGRSFFTGKQNILNESMITGKIDLVARIMPEGGPKPVLKQSLCTGCLNCVNSCPVSVIDPVTKTYVDNSYRNKCLSCMSCVKTCPAGARSYSIFYPVKYFLDKFYFSKAKRERKEPLLLSG